MNSVSVVVGENYIEVGERFYPSHTFQLVDFVPYGYEIWNIGSQHMAEGYLPLCRLSTHQHFPGGRDVEIETLKAIRIDGADKILDAIGGGQNTVEKMEAYVKRYRNSKPGTWSYAQRKRMIEALPIMKQIKWH